MDLRRPKKKEKNSGAADRFTIISTITSLARTYILVPLSAEVIADAGNAVGYAATYFRYIIMSNLLTV